MRRALATALAAYAALLALHAPLLRLPYYWDEAGYFIFAALDCFRHGWLVPRSTLPNGHPPLLSLYLAGVWLLAGFHPWVTRAAMLVWAAALLLGVERLARPRLGRAAWLPAVLLGLAPLVFAQATLAQLDLPVAALVVWALVALDGERTGTAALVFSAACLVKETAVIAPLALYAAALPRAGERRRAWPLLVPAAVVGGWFLYYHHATGYWFGNPQFFAYNVGQAALSPGRIALALARRVWQLAFYDGTGLLTVLAVVGAWRRWPRPPRRWAAVVAAYLLFHAVVGGAVLARYLLPALALYFIWLGEALLRVRFARAAVAACAAMLVVSWFWNPPYPFPYEDNLAYATFVRLHVEAARAWERHPPAGPIWTAWPATDELTRPELGYVSRPLPVRPLDNFGSSALAQVAGDPQALYLYSQIYQPQVNLARRLPFWARWSERFFNFDPPAEPQRWLVRTHLRAWDVTIARGQWVVLAR